MYDVIVIGAGPTGASAALFTAKAGKKTLVLDSGQSMTRRAWIENHYGVAETSGPDLVDQGIAQAKKFGAEIVEQKVVSLSPSGEGVRVVTAEGEYEAAHVILATGLLTDLAEASGIATVPGTEPRVKTVFGVDAGGKTNLPRVWAAGGSAGTSLHTIITAGDGAKVAINVLSEMAGERYVDHDVLKK